MNHRRRRGERPGANDPRAVAPLARAGDGSTSDEALIACIADGGVDALAALYDRHGGRAWSLARIVCRDDSLAEDAVQQAFVGVWRNARRFDPARGRALSWLLMLVHRRAAHLIKREE